MDRAYPDKERMMKTNGSFNRWKGLAGRRLLLPLLALTLTPVAAVSGSAQFPPYRIDILDNGLRVIVHEDHELPVVTMEVMIRAGSSYDPAGKEGLANITADLITEGTESKSATEVAEAIEFVGGTLSAVTGFDASYVTCEVLKKDFGLGLGLLSDILIHPAFSVEEIERQRSQILTTFTGERDQKDVIANKHYQEVLFGSHPYGHPIMGREASVRGITRDDIVEFYLTFFRPNNSTLIVAGDVDRTEVVDALNGALGEWESGLVTRATPPDVERPSGYRIRLVNKPDVTQSEIRIGYPGIVRKDPDYFPLLLMNYTLGSGIFSSRLMQTVRSEMGLTYGISSSLGARVFQGPFTISTFTRTETTMEAIRAIFAVIDEMQREGITETEFENAKARFIGGFPLSVETPSQIAGKILQAELYGLGEDYISHYTTAIDEVSLEEVNRVASRFLRTEDLVIVVVANADQVRDQLGEFGEVEEVFFIEMGPEGSPPHDHHH